jgi:hypothetical protein
MLRRVKGSRCPSGSTPRSLCLLLTTLSILAGCLQESPPDVNNLVSSDRSRGDAGVGPAAGAIGASCSALSPCGPGQTCATGVPGGYCTADCSTVACPSNATCVQLGSADRICIRSCSSRADCRSDHQCIGGLCLPRCMQDSDCDSHSCDVASGACRQTSLVGGACQVDSDCGSMPAFCDTSQPGGYCSLPCGGTQNGTCPSGAHCSSGGGSAACLKDCKTAADCTASAVCVANVEGIRECVPKCTRDAGCGPGTRCDVGNGICVATGPAGGQIGAACTSKSDCAGAGAGAQCLSGSDGFTGGYCIAACTTTPCPAGGVCLTLDTAKACVAGCKGPQDCRSDYFCGATSAMPDVGFCVPRCSSDASCTSPERPTCDKTSGVCMAMSNGDSTGEVRNEIIDLTPTPLAIDTQSTREYLQVTVPPDAVSVELFAEGISDPSVPMDFARLVQTDDDFATTTLLYKSGALASPMQVFPPVHPGGVALLYPNGPTSSFKPSSAGTTIKLGALLFAAGPTTVRVFASIKHAKSPVLRQGTVDLNLYFVGVSDLGLTAAKAKADPQFQAILTRAQELWADANLTYAGINYIDVPEPDASRLSDITDDEVYADLMRTGSSGGKDGALNMFFVHSIQGGGGKGFTIIGQSAGIPGVPRRGNPLGGVAVTSADFATAKGRDTMAIVMAHEGGHWMGLFHPTEQRGTAFDRLADTPECKATRDANGDGIVDKKECAGFGAENVMFWLASGTTLTPNQSYVILRNAIVH